MKYRILIATLVTLFIMGVVASLVSASTEVELERIDVKTKQQEIDTLKELQDVYEIELEEADKTVEELQKLQEAQQELQKENERLQQELALKRARQAEEASKRNIVARTITPTASASPAVSYGGNCSTWIAQAGITEVASANELIRRESGCNPNAVNSSSGACGVAQELPCGKSGCSLGDGACQVKWMNSYVKARYGSWSSAVAFHNANNWY